MSNERVLSKKRKEEISDHHIHRQKEIHVGHLSRRRIKNISDQSYTIKSKKTNKLLYLILNK